MIRALNQRQRRQIRRALDLTRKLEVVLAGITGPIDSAEARRARNRRPFSQTHFVNVVLEKRISRRHLSRWLRDWKKQFGWGWTGWGQMVEHSFLLGAFFIDKKLTCKPGSHGAAAMKRLREEIAKRGLIGEVKTCYRALVSAGEDKVVAKCRLSVEALEILLPQPQKSTTLQTNQI